MVEIILLAIRWEMCVVFNTLAFCAYHVVGLVWTYSSLARSDRWFTKEGEGSKKLVWNSGRQIFVNMQGVSFISAPSTVALSHINPESAATYRYNCDARDDDEKNLLWKNLTELIGWE